MSKRRISSFAVNTVDWQEYHPYKTFGTYDAYYLRLANRVFEELSHPKYGQQSAFTRAQRIELSVVLTCWFEDQVNNTGIWRTFTRKNKSLFGYWLPFFDLEDYDSEDFNPQDIRYLMWHYRCKAASIWLSPESAALEVCAGQLYDIFEEVYEEAPTTELYKKLLSIPDEVHFFDLKGRLYALATHNYLLGPEFKHKLNKESADILKAHSLKGYGKAALDKIIYSLHNDFLFHRTSSFLGYCTAEWMADIAVCSDKIREDIRGMTHWISLNMFTFESADASQYHLRHEYTQRVFPVNKTSADLKGLNPGEQVILSLVPWQGEYWISGAVMFYGKPDTSSKKTEPLSNTPFYAWSETQQKTIRETAAEMEANHLEFFGDYMAFFESKRSLQQALHNQNELYNQKIAKTTATSPPDLHTTQKLKEKANKPFWTLVEGKRMGVFFEPGEGMRISEVLPKIVSLLQISDRTLEQNRFLFNHFFTHCSPFIAQNLLEKYPDHQIQFPINTQIPLAPHIDFLLRFYNPTEFREKTPKNTLVL